MWTILRKWNFNTSRHQTCQWGLLGTISKLGGQLVVSVVDCGFWLLSIQASWPSKFQIIVRLPNHSSHCHRLHVITFQILAHPKSRIDLERTIISRFHLSSCVLILMSREIFPYWVSALFRYRAHSSVQLTMLSPTFLTPLMVALHF